MSTSTFVFVPGAWHPSACWQRVVPLLEEQGHRVLTPELLGMAADPTPPSQVNLAAWADQLADIIRKEEKAVILVGHSRAGVVISEVAERVPEKIKLLVYLTAFLVPTGESLSDNVPTGGDPGMFVQNPDGTSSLATDKIVPIFYNTTASQWAERAISLTCPEPPNIFTTPVQLTDGRFGRVPRAYIECKQDNAITLSAQRSMQNRLPCKYVVTMDTDHSPFFSAPSELVANLIDLASKQ